MAGAARINDRSTGHPDCFPSRPAISGSPDTFINGRAAHRQGDSWATHCKQCGDDRPCHTGNLASGSSTVFVNGRQAGRIGDPVNCGDRVLTGSGDVFIGG